MKSALIHQSIIFFFFSFFSIHLTQLINLIKYIESHLLSIFFNIPHAKHLKKNFWKSMNFFFTCLLFGYFSIQMFMFKDIFFILLTANFGDFRLMIWVMIHENV